MCVWNMEKAWVNAKSYPCLPDTCSLLNTTENRAQIYSGSETQTWEAKPQEGRAL